MGMPISNFTVFKALAEKDTDSIEFELARGCFEDFNLLAFIVYDPVRHVELFDKLSNSFNLLDKKTGEKLLFFAVCNAPDNWDEKVAQRKYSSIYNWSKEQFVKNNLSNTNLHNSDAAYAIARAFKIDSENLPCIVVTNDFEKRQFCWFKTNHEHIESQLINLSYIAEEYPELKSEWKNAKKIMKDKHHNIDICEGFGLNGLNNSMAETLSTVLAFLEAVCSKDENIRIMAKQEVPNKLKKLQSELEGIRRSLHYSGKEYSKKFEELNINIACLISILDIQPSTISKFIYENERYLEKESYNNLYVGMKVFEIFSDKKRLEYLIGSNNFNLVDFTPSVICFAKAFEREIGLSLGHTVRKYVGVMLPTYYNRYDPKLEKGKSCFMPHASLVSEPKLIEFNQGNKGRWIAPGIGQMLIAIKTLYLEGDDELNYFINHVNNFENFTRIWKDIGRKRNSCAHTEIIKKNEALEVRKYIEILADDGVFCLLNNIKLRYKL